MSAFILLFDSVVFLLLCSSLVCRDTIDISHLLLDGNSDPVISANGKFQLGFFTPTGSPDSTRRYVGIWYNNLNPRTVVWVANRDHPVEDDDHPGVFAIADDGNLVVLDGNGIRYWSSGIEGTKNGTSYQNRKVKLLDSGNLVVSDDQWATFLWQSFQHPTDTFLPGMKMDENMKLTSWKTAVDPKEGEFTFQVDESSSTGSNFIIKNGFGRYWRSGKLVDSDFSEINPAIPYILSNFNRKLRPSKISENYNATRIVMDTTGQIQFWNLDVVNKVWSLIWWEPRDNCTVFKACGKFGCCNNDNNIFSCKCLPGFRPSSEEEWNQNIFRDGCAPKSTECNISTDKFLSLKMMKVSDSDSEIVANDEADCRSSCLRDCHCKAYSFEKIQQRGGSSFNCFIWTEDINNLREEDVINSGQNLFVRVAASDIEITGRGCQPCGTNMVPYPLSTGVNCGDHMYSSFFCNNSTERLSFKALSGTYNVISVNSDTRTFIVQAKLKDNCNATYSREEISLHNIVQLDQSLPFKFKTYFCHETSGSIATAYIAEVEIEWDPPPQPTCNSTYDCNDWPHSTCNVAEDGSRRCLCNINFQWNPRNLSCTQETTEGFKPPEVSSERKKPVSLIVGVILASTVVLSSIVFFFYIWRKKTKRKESRKNMESNAARLYDTEKRIKDLMNIEEFTEEDKKGIDVPFFSLEIIMAATENFSDANRLGRGGFGPVYKGKFPRGQEIAIKRLSSISGQGLEEFKNEVVLIARLQHRNLVRLLGYCVKGDEKMLLYEYMPNKSLDSFIFDQKLSMMLNWEMRFNIILGIARGLVYLHQDSRLRIIHRDLKTSNILLDEEMNPKISDFGLARMFQGKQTEGTTNRVIGTYGYMAPEYALDGLFSIKSDVFSFGVVVLEILSGKRNTGYFKSDQSSRLLGYAWRLWREDKTLDLLDETLRGSYKGNEFMKCVTVALLCVQEEPADRPTMSNVAVMLSSENATFATPKQPAFVVREAEEGQHSGKTTSSSSKQEISADSVTNVGTHSTTTSL